MENSTEPGGIVADTTPADFFHIRVVFLNRIWVGLLVVVSFAAPLSLARTFFTGWQPAYFVQFFMLAMLGAGFLFREQFSFRVRALTAVTVLDLNGIVSVVSFGMFGASWWWLIMSSLLIAILFRTRAGMIHAACAMLLLTAVGLSFVLGGLTLDFDANAYSRQLLPWASLLTGPVLFTVFAFWAFDAMLKPLRDLRQPPS